MFKRKTSSESAPNRVHSRGPASRLSFTPLHGSDDSCENVNRTNQLLCIESAKNSVFGRCAIMLFASVLSWQGLQDLGVQAWGLFLPCCGCLRSFRSWDWLPSIHLAWGEANPPGLAAWVALGPVMFPFHSGQGAQVCE